MLAEGITPIGDGLLDVAEEHLKGLLVADDINEIYDVEQTPFARGKFAAVRRAIHKRSGVHFAAKFLKRRRRAQSSDKEIKHEIAVLMLCNDADNIVKLNAVHESRSDTALLLELATGGELQTLLDNEECLTEAQARICMREVLKALQFLHKRSIVHLDLKPQNILLVGERIEDGLKLCDFGISRIVAEGTNIREIVGTPDYVAPEVLQYEPLSLLTDIWSVGVLTYVLLSGFSPFGGETKQETFLNISQCSLTFPDKLFGGVSTAAIDFIRKTLRIKPNDRMTAAGCLEHIWLKDECSIDRHLFNNITKQQQQKQNGTNGHADNYDDDDDVDDDYGDDDDDDDDDADDDDQIVDDDNDDVDDLVHNDKEIITNRPERVVIQTPQVITNSLMVEDCCAVNFTSSSSSHSINGTNCCANADADANADDDVDVDVVDVEVDVDEVTIVANGISRAVAAASATAAISPLLCSNEQFMEEQNEQAQQKRQHQMLHTKIMRRHSTESNKENTYTKENKSSISVGGSGIGGSGSNTVNLSSISSLMMNGDEKDNDIHNATTSTVAMQVLFPDAPTTPKVIRKAPLNDNSPTSVKALVKKFQLERDHDHSTIVTETANDTVGAGAAGAGAGGGGGVTDVTVKISQSNGAVVDGVGRGPSGAEIANCKKKASSAAMTGGGGNSTSTSSPTSDTLLKLKLTNGQKWQHQQQQKYKPHQRQSLNPATTALSSAIHITNGCSRRSSEPLTGIHPVNRKLQITSSSAPITSITVSPSSSSTSTSSFTTTHNTGAGSLSGNHHYKTTCVYCLPSHNNHNNRIINTATATTTTTTINGCRHSSSSSTSTTSALIVSSVSGGSGQTKRTTTMHLNSLNGIQQTNTKCISQGNRERCTSISNHVAVAVATTSSSSSTSLAAVTSTPPTSPMQHSTLLFSSHQRLINSTHAMTTATTTRSHQHHRHSHHHHSHHHHSHHHHHNMMKNANGATGNGISLDQGIIC